MKSLVFILALALVSAPAISQEQEELSSDELSLQDKANKRLYPGGPDEEKLKVLDGVSSATANLNSYQIEREVYQSLFNEASQKSEDEE